ncbi:YggS family pyridoxal phosphate-dependent enzyme [Microvirga sp. W0021]|uniref:Pyridoxal phosphate homeostasis protein n=1 Tax=Hohaiivirga grylli TaxID=3133970 RepID=A0ABV0BFY4_9HYPH
MTDTRARYQDVLNAISRSAKDSGRKPEDICLIAVSKTYPAEAIEPVLEAGQRDFGENYVQEASAKWPVLRERFPATVLHLIGPLQSNKAREAVELFDVIQSVDRESLAKELAKEIKRKVEAGGQAPKLLVQINTGEEPQKGGVLPQDADAFIAACREQYGLKIHGLMCIPPFDEPPSPHFALLRKIAERNGLKELSMGMSADFDPAIQMGATCVRIGTAIFGSRQKA